MSELQKKITLYGLTMIAVGSSIGSGIFVTPGQIAHELPNASLILGVWILGGLLALTGALTFAELGGMFTGSGGVYVYLKNAYGDLAGFLYGWVTLMVINTGALAGLCVAFAEYLKLFFPQTGEYKSIIAAVTMISLTAINMLGVHVSQGVSNVLTTIKLTAIAGIALTGIIFYDPVKVPIDFSFSSGFPDSLISSLLIAMTGVFFSTGGWHHASFVSAEVIRPEKNVARAMLIGTLIVTLSYVLVNLAYLRLLPIPVLAATNTAAGDAITSVTPFGGKLVAIAITLSIFGTISIYSMTAPRIYFAMAKDGIFFKQLALLHPVWKTPYIAMMIQVVWALGILFFFQSYFDKIITFVTFMDACFFALAAASIFVFRKKIPDHHRPYKTWAYPYIPILFIAVYSIFAVNILWQKPDQAIPGLLIMGIGIAVYYFFKKKSKNEI